LFWIKATSVEVINPERTADFSQKGNEAMRHLGRHSIAACAMIASSPAVAAEPYIWNYPPMWHWLSHGWFFGPFMIVLLAILIVLFIRSGRQSA